MHIIKGWNWSSTHWLAPLKDAGYLHLSPDRSSTPQLCGISCRLDEAVGVREPTVEKWLYHQCGCGDAQRKDFTVCLCTPIVPGSSRTFLSSTAGMRTYCRWMTVRLYPWKLCSIQQNLRLKRLVQSATLWLHRFLRCAPTQIMATAIFYKESKEKA